MIEVRPSTLRFRLPNWRPLVTRNGVILLVEDNPNDVELTLRAFEKSNLGNEIVVARDGEQAIHYLFATGPHADRGPMANAGCRIARYEAAQLDGLGGLTAYACRQTDQAIACCDADIRQGRSDVASSYDLGANSFVRKPVDFGEFVDAAKRPGSIGSS